MQCNVLFDYVMRSLWGDGSEDLPKEAIAVASYIKNHKVNPENCFEVVHIMWPETKFEPMIPSAEQSQQTDGGEVWFYLTFPDESRALVVSHFGIGGVVEVM